MGEAKMNPGREFIASVTHHGGFRRRSKPWFLHCWPSTEIPERSAKQMTEIQAVTTNEYKAFWAMTVFCLSWSPLSFCGCLLSFKRETGRYKLTSAKNENGSQTDFYKSAFEKKKPVSPWTGLQVIRNLGKTTKQKAWCCMWRKDDGQEGLDYECGPAWWIWQLHDLRESSSRRQQLKPKF